ncbi:MAG: hypothetical protein ISS15_06725 [Alphaproteobacteria bacterium]|nr:hypothetical protein [Alphaproteobacteria bacterium]MBL7097331.1 hypothetical protein [Alphaproteobacteria bacterium]
MEGCIRVKKYRDRAEELRMVAQNFTDPERRQVLIDLAADYERMADQVDRGLCGFDDCPTCAPQKR